ncbi:glucose-6-phosphate dehydrogenase [Isobaculum melis]|uniref:glucose-6-phosphate dehydrogenase n=1 Tax=Isobaculum melis TaxID=142588 RepID=UPI0015A6BD7A|nr:glucose-6-phosphate dehydrogenase [Isobaculum melis]
MDEKKALITIFGGTGDLAKRKLYPSLYRLYRKGYLNKHFAVIGTARREWSDAFYREVVIESVGDLAESPAHVAEFASHFYYQAHNVTDTEHYDKLKELSETLDAQYHLDGNRVFYLAMAPSFFGTITEHIKTQHLLTDHGYRHLVIEKPFGHDYESATVLNEQIRKVFEEDEIYRIDHYLGKEMIQNISAVRFANTLFESLWNNRYIENVQVTLSEALGVEERGGYYETSGALLDMVQNHVLQVISLLVMEPPIKLTDAEIREEKIRALRSIRVMASNEVNDYFVRGQYGPSETDPTLKGYRQEEHVAPDSTTETFVAGKIMVDNFRWKGVPFYIRTGKRMKERGTQINIHFKNVPMNLFSNEDQENLCPNILTIFIQPTEGFSMRLNAKKVGQGLHTNPIKLEYLNPTDKGLNTPEAYEKLILDCLNGDSTNFTHWDEVALSWKFVDVIQDTWKQNQPDFPNYASGTMGPACSDELLAKNGHKWFWNEIG